MYDNDDGNVDLSIGQWERPHFYDDDGDNDDDHGDGVDVDLSIGQWERSTERSARLL